MKTIQKDELFQHLSGFLKDKGIELKEGSYSQRIQKSCGLLTEAINLGHQGLEKAKTEIDRKLDLARQVIHEKTAPKARSPFAGPGAQAKAGAPGNAPSPKPGKAKPKADARPPKTAAKKRGGKKGA